MNDDVEDGPPPKKKRKKALDGLNDQTDGFVETHVVSPICSPSLNASCRDEQERCNVLWCVTHV